MKRLFTLALCAFLLLSGCGLTADTPQTGLPADQTPSGSPPSEPEEAGPAAQPPAVSGQPDPFTLAWPEMNDPAFWLALAEEPQRVRMTGEEIADYNAGLARAEGTDVEDLSAWPEALSAARLTQLIDTYDDAPFAGADTGAGPITEAQRQAIRDNRNLVGVADSNPVRYGFVTQNLILRSYPSPLPVYDGADSREYDLAAETALKVWEPVLLLHPSADGQWLLARAYDYLGWVPTQSVAACPRESWDSLRRQLKEDFLTVTAPRLVMDGSFSYPQQEDLILKMGTRLPLASGGEADNATADNCHLVRLPVRRDDGTLSLTVARVPKGEEAVVGALPYTTENLLKQAFRLLGHRYGWGGTAEGWDCSSLCQDVYRTMGFDLPRNASSQRRMTGSLSLEARTAEGKGEALAAALPGALLEMPGHQTMVVGQYQGRTYLIHSTHGVYDSQGRFYNANSVVVTSAEALRSNGRSIRENGRALSLPEGFAGQ